MFGNGGLIRKVQRKWINHLNRHCSKWTNQSFCSQLSLCNNFLRLPDSDREVQHKCPLPPSCGPTCDSVLPLTKVCLCWRENMLLSTSFFFLRVLIKLQQWRHLGQSQPSTASTYFLPLSQLEGVWLATQICIYNKKNPQRGCRWCVRIQTWNQGVIRTS